MPDILHTTRPRCNENQKVVKLTGNGQKNNKNLSAGEASAHPVPAHSYTLLVYTPTEHVHYSNQPLDYHMTLSYQLVATVPVVTNSKAIAPQQRNYPAAHSEILASIHRIPTHNLSYNPYKKVGYHQNQYTDVKFLKINREDSKSLYQLQKFMNLSPLNNIRMPIIMKITY